jgi:hypothetical protein
MARTARKKSRPSSSNMVARMLNPDPEGREPEPLKRAPVGMDGAIGAEIGKLIELQLPGLVWKPRGVSKRPRLIWFPEQKALGFFTWEAGEKTGEMPEWLRVRPSTREFDYLDESRDVGPAVRAFEAFMDRGAKQTARTYDFPFRSTRAWYSVDKVRRIDYWSDKFRAEREYTHESGPGVRLYVYGSPRRFGPAFWLVHGGKMNVTARGIIN